MPVNEPSGSHQLPSHTPGTFSIDGRTMVMAALFLVGGAGTGAGTSLLGGQGVSEKVEALAVEVRDLRIAVERRADSDEIYRSRLDDHEKRLRELERGR